jgi:hypothetical protein
MDSAVVMALSAALGSLAGGAASIATTWITQRNQFRRANNEWKLREREALYAEFLTEASRLAVDALSNSLERPDQLAVLYGILSRVRLIANDQVLASAEDCCHQIVERYQLPNLMADQLHAAIEADDFDIMKPFSAACRTELQTFSPAS